MKPNRGLAVLVVAVFAAGVVALAVGPGDQDAGPEQAWLDVDGSATVTAVDGATRTIADDDETVRFGEQVALERGSAVLELADGSTFELRHRDGVGSALEVGSPVRLTGGDVLISGGFPAQVALGAATLTAQGALRLDAEDTTASAYAGRTRVTGAGDVGVVPALRRLELVAGAIPEPVVFDGGDPWDRRFLGEAIAFGERLEALARGYTSELGTETGRSVAFFRSVLPELADERELGEDLMDPARSPGETLVGAAITVRGRQGTFRERWQEVFAFRAAGAAWGLVALDQGVRSAPVLQAIEVALGVSEDQAPTGAPPSGPRRRPPATAPVDTRPPITGTTITPSTTTPTRTTTTTTTTTAPPPPPPSGGGILSPVIDPVAAVVGGLLEVLGLRGG